LERLPRDHRESSGAAARMSSSGVLARIRGKPGFAFRTSASRAASRRSGTAHCGLSSIAHVGSRRQPRKVQSPRRAVAILAACVLLIAGSLLFLGGQVPGCLGPLDVTEVQCVSGFNLSHDPVWSPGPGATWLVAALAFVLATSAVVPWRALSSRSAAVVIASAVPGSLAGLLVYAVSRPVTLTGPISTGEVITVVLPWNVDAQVLDMVIGAGAMVIVAGRLLGSRRHSSSLGVTGVA
jgi:hypothetical protein